MSTLTKFVAVLLALSFVIGFEFGGEWRGEEQPNESHRFAIVTLRIEDNEAVGRPSIEWRLQRGDWGRYTTLALCSFNEFQTAGATRSQSLLCAIRVPIVIEGRERQQIRINSGDWSELIVNEQNEAVGDVVPASRRRFARVIVTRQLLDTGAQDIDAWLARSGRWAAVDAEGRQSPTLSSVAAVRYPVDSKLRLVGNAVSHMISVSVSGQPMSLVSGEWGVKADGGRVFTTDGRLLLVSDDDVRPTLRGVYEGQLPGQDRLYVQLEPNCSPYRLSQGQFLPPASTFPDDTKELLNQRELDDALFLATCRELVANRAALRPDEYGVVLEMRGEGEGAVALLPPTYQGELSVETPSTATGLSGLRLKASLVEGQSAIELSGQLPTVEIPVHNRMGDGTHSYAWPARAGHRRLSEGLRFSPSGGSQLKQLIVAVVGPKRVGLPFRNGAAEGWSMSSDANGWVVNVDESKFRDYRVRVNVQRPVMHPVGDAGQVRRVRMNTAGWELRSGGHEMGRLQLDSQGQLTFRELRSLASDDRDGNWWLIPVGGGVVVEPVRFPAGEEAKRLEGLTEHEVMLDAKYRTIQIQPDQLRGFAPAIQILLADGSTLEVVGADVDKLGCEPNTVRWVQADGTVVPTNADTPVAIDLGRVSAVAPVGFVSFPDRLDDPAVVLDSLLEAAVVGPDNPAFSDRLLPIFAQSTSGLDVYSPSGATPVLWLPKQHRFEVLEPNPLSSRYWSERSLAAEDAAEIWNGNGWTPARPGRLQIGRATTPRTVCIVISACRVARKLAAQDDDPFERHFNPAKARGVASGEDAVVSPEQLDARWLGVAPKLMNTLRDAGYDRCALWLVFAADGGYRVASLSTVDLGHGNANAMVQLRDLVRERLRAYSDRFGASAYLDAAPEEIAKGFIACMTSVSADTSTPATPPFEPGSALLVVLPEGETAMLRQEPVAHPLVRSIYMEGFCAESVEQVAEKIGSAFSGRKGGAR